jgi:hypothetical protein
VLYTFEDLETGDVRSAIAIKTRQRLGFGSAASGPMSNAPLRGSPARSTDCQQCYMRRCGYFVLEIQSRSSPLEIPSANASIYWSHVPLKLLQNSM